MIIPVIKSKVWYVNPITNHLIEHTFQIIITSIRNLLIYILFQVIQILAHVNTQHNTSIIHPFNTTQFLKSILKSLVQIVYIRIRLSIVNSSLYGIFNFFVVIIFLNHIIQRQILIKLITILGCQRFYNLKNLSLTITVSIILQSSPPISIIVIQ